MTPLQERIERLAATQPGDPEAAEARAAFEELRDALERGEVRAAEPDESAATGWRVNAWVKRGILLGFRIGVNVNLGPAGSGGLSFVDRDTFPVRQFTPADGVRVVAGGSSVRRGAYLGKGVICVPPMYINTGAWVDEGSLIDSHALVGSCAQVGRNVHVSAAAQLGGVLEPVNAAPVIIEDDVLVGGNCGVYEGTLVRSGAVLAPGTILSRGTPIYDLVRGEIYRAASDTPLIVPKNAVVVPGSRPPSAPQPKGWSLSLYAPVIVKYRDEKTSAATALEGALR